MPKKSVQKVHNIPGLTYAISQEVVRKDFRVAIFGSARVKKGDKSYKQIYKLAKQVGQQDFDVVTGGGPGMMEAANAGHCAGKGKGKAYSIGLPIELPFEEHINKYLDIQQHFKHFSERLDNFMVLSHVVVITPGGVGTCLEFFYTWQLTQVRHISKMPIIFVGRMWKGLLKWLEKPIKMGLISSQDMENVFYARNNEEALEMILEVNQSFQQHGEKYFENYKKYRLG